MGLFLTFSVFELQRGYLYQNGVEFCQKVIGAGLNLFWGHLHYFPGGIWTFPLLSDTYASAPIAERAIWYVTIILSNLKIVKLVKISQQGERNKNKNKIARSAMRALAYVADSRGKVHISLRSSEDDQV